MMELKRSIYYGELTDFFNLDDFRFVGLASIEI